MIDKSARAISERLRRCAELSATMQRRVDLSPNAISERLREVAEVSALCFRLEEIGRKNRIKRG